MMDSGAASSGDGGGGGMGTGVGNETLACRTATSSGTEGVACNASDPDDVRGRVFVRRERQQRRSRLLQVLQR